METESSVLLEALLTPDTIRLHVHAADPMDVIEQAGRLLVANGGAEERYVEAMKQSLKLHGPYMVIVPGGALLHARPEDGVKSVCMSLVTLDPPLNFGNEDNDPVSLAFALGAVDDDKHQEALAALARLLQDEDALAKLRGTASIEEACDIIAAVPRLDSR